MSSLTPAPPVVDGVTLLAPAPEGWVVDLENPTRTAVMEHYLIFGIMGGFAFIALCQRYYTKIFLSQGLKIDDCEYLPSLRMRNSSTDIAVQSLCF
jgi:hypothetical protein